MLEKPLNERFGDYALIERARDRGTERRLPVPIVGGDERILGYPGITYLEQPVCIRSRLFRLEARPQRIKDLKAIVVYRVLSCRCRGWGYLKSISDQP